jgi:carboxylesterase type B
VSSSLSISPFCLSFHSLSLRITIRNSGDIEDMIEDIKLAVLWTYRNARRFGGNPEKIVLAGQSAGAHITLCLLVDEYLQRKKDERLSEDMDLRRTQEKEERVSRNYKLVDELVHTPPSSSSKKHGNHLSVACEFLFLIIS